MAGSELPYIKHEHMATDTHTGADSTPTTIYREVGTLTHKHVHAHTPIENYFDY